MGFRKKTIGHGVMDLEYQSKWTIDGGRVNQ